MSDRRGCSQWKCLFWEYWYLNKTTPRAIWYKCCSLWRLVVSKLDMDFAALRLFQEDQGPQVGLNHKFWGCFWTITLKSSFLPSTVDKSPCWKPNRSARYPMFVAWRVSSLWGLQNTSRTCSLEPWCGSTFLNAFWNSLDSCWTNSWNCFWYWDTWVTWQQTSSLSRSPAFWRPVAHIDSLIGCSWEGLESRSLLLPGDSFVSVRQWCSRTPWHSASMLAGSASLAMCPPPRPISLTPSGLADFSAWAWVEELASVTARWESLSRTSRSWESHSAAVSYDRSSGMSRRCAQTIGATWPPDSRSRHMDGPNVPFRRWWVTIPSLPEIASWTFPSPLGPLEELRRLRRSDRLMLAVRCCWWSIEWFLGPRLYGMHITGIILTHHVTCCLMFSDHAVMIISIVNIHVGIRLRIIQGLGLYHLLRWVSCVNMGVSYLILVLPWWCFQARHVNSIWLGSTLFPGLTSHPVHHA